MSSDKQPEQDPKENPWDAVFDTIVSGNNPLWVFGLAILALPGATWVVLTSTERDPEALLDGILNTVPLMICAVFLPATIAIAAPLLILAASWEIAQRLYIK